MTQTIETTTTTELNNDEYLNNLEELFITKLMPAMRALDSDHYEQMLDHMARYFQQKIKEAEYVFTVDEYTYDTVEAIQEVGGNTEWNEQGNVKVTIPGRGVACTETVPNGSLHQILVTLTTGKVLCYDWYDLEHGDQPGWIELTVKH